MCYKGFHIKWRQSRRISFVAILNGMKKQANTRVTALMVGIIWKLTKRKSLFRKALKWPSRFGTNSFTCSVHVPPPWSMSLDISNEWQDQHPRLRYSQDECGSLQQAACPIKWLKGQFTTYFGPTRMTPFCIGHLPMFTFKTHALLSFTHLHACLQNLIFMKILFWFPNFSLFFRV